MKSHGGLWARIVAPENLLAAWGRVRRGHCGSPVVRDYEKNLAANLEHLRGDMVAGTYRPGAYRQFGVLDPKPRTISCAPVRDRIVHHALCGVVVPLLERSFFEDSYDCKMDVRRYFDSIEHDRLLSVGVRSTKGGYMKSNIWISSTVAAVICLSHSVAQSAPPPNDDFANAILVSGFPATVTGSNIEATIESGEPLPDGYEYNARKSVWYEWTAPTNGLVQVDTFGSYYQPLLGSPLPWFNPNPGVWTGTSVSALTEVRSGGSQQSRYLTVSSGTTYRIAVYGLGNDYLDEGQIVLNITNDVSSHITGTVTGPDGTSPLQGILAQANRWNGTWWENVSWDFTDAAGKYTIRGLTGDTYRVVFADWENRNGTPQYITEYYEDAEDLDSANDIVVPPTSVISNINASLAAASQISGTVTGPDQTTPLEGIGVTAYRWNTTLADWDWMGETETDASGFYTIAGLAAGTYHVRFRDWSNGGYIREFYDDAVDHSSATDIAVTSGASVVGIDASLADASKISGTVTGPDGVTPIFSIAVLHQWNGSGWDQVSKYWTESDGVFVFGELASGTYRVEYSDYPSDDDDYAGEFYDNAISLDSATNVILPSATTLSGLDASLAVAVPNIMGLRMQTNRTDIIFSGVVGRDYVLQRGILQSNQWTDVGAPTDCVEGTNILTDAEAAVPSFWRVRRYP